MPRLAANLTMLWNELPFLERFAAAERAGFQAVECQFPYAFDKQQLMDALGGARLELVLHNLPAGDWARGERGIALLPDRRAEFRDGVGLAIGYARALGTGKLNCLVGIAPPGADLSACRRTLVDNLRFAARELEAAGVQLLVEPLNTRDVPGFYLNSSEQALELIAEVGSSNLLLQYDLFHMHVMQEDVSSTLERQLPRIAHVQIADDPGRHEPGSGNIPYERWFELLDASGYAGHVGAEYHPRGSTDDGLSWAEPYLARG